jgi:hypothetical protein
MSLVKKISLIVNADNTAHKPITSRESTRARALKKGISNFVPRNPEQTPNVPI